MKCETTANLIHAYLDNELDLATALDFEAHLQACEPCRLQLQTLKQLQSTIKQAAPYYQAPAALRISLQQSLNATGNEHNRFRRRFSAIFKPWQASQWVTALAMLLLAFNLTLLFKQPAAVNQLSEEIVSSHVRSLMTDHLTDVASTDQHTVKPWFNGKLDFSPPIIDLDREGFPLVGGRLDYVDARPVAALIYRRRQHLINVFIWPENQKDTHAEYSDSHNGYNLISLKSHGMNYWVVSDLNLKELMALKNLLILP